MSTVLTRLKRVVTLEAGGTPSVDDQEFWASDASGVPWVSIGDMSDGSEVTHTDRTLTESGVSSKNLRIAPPGTVLFAMYASVGAIAQLGVAACWNQALLGVMPKPGLADSRFVRYWLEHLRPSLGGLVRSNTQDNLNAEQVGNLPFPVIDLDQQRRIAKFLDVETEHIDELMGTKKRMIERSLELRRSVTYEAVAGSLFRRQSDMRESAIAWLRSAPAHWREASLRLVAELGSGHTPSRSHPEWWVDCTVPWVTTGEVARLRSDRHEFIYETREKVSELGLANSSAVVRPAGTVVLCRTSASAGYSGIMAEGMATSQDFATWTCGALIRPRFLLLCLRAMRRDLLERLGQGSTHVTIYMPDIESIRVPLPPVEEQDRIVDEAWRRMNALAKAEDVLDKQITLLEERRRSLITAAVTGEMEVP